MVEDSLLIKLAKLKAKADSCQAIGNQVEAELFAAKVQELLLAHKLSMADIDTATLDMGDPIQKESVDPPGLEKKRTRTWYSETLAQTVAKAHFCRSLIRSDSSTISFVGRNSDREVAIYIYTYLLRMMTYLEKDERRKFKRLGEQRMMEVVRALERGETPPSYDEKIQLTEFTDAFYRGFIEAIDKRYKEQRAQVADPGNALVKADGQVVVWIQENLQLRSTSGIPAGGLGNHMGQQAGRRAGEAVDISKRGVAGSKGRLLG